MAINCPQFNNDRNKQPFDHRETTRIRRKIREFNRLLRQASQAPRNQARQARFHQLRNDALNEWERLVADIAEIRPQDVQGMADLLAAQLGIHSRRLGLDPSLNYSKAGEIRIGLLDAKQTIEGLISTAGRIVSLERLQPFMRTFNQMARQLNVPKQTIRELIDDTLTVGQIGRTQSSAVYYRHNVLGKQSLVDTIQRRRYQDYVQRMRNAGFSTQQVDSLVNMATSVADSFDSVRAFAQAVGVEVGQEDNIGYFARRITRDFQLRLQDLKIEDLLQSLQEDGVTLATLHNKSRSTNLLVPEDLGFVSAILGIPTQEIVQMLDDPLAWRQYLHNNLSAEQLDLLIDAGVMQKLPMSSREVFEYFVRQYQLPYRHLSEMFELDPTTVVQAYTTNLQRSAGNSAMLRRIVDGEGLRRGWSVTRQMVESDPSTYREFVPLGSSFRTWAERARINTTQLQQNMGLPAGMLDSLHDIYVHPMVARQWTALMEVSMSPALMDQFGRTLSYVGRWFNKRILSNVQYVSRSVFQNIMSSMMAGANAVYHIPSIIDVARLMSSGLSTFDNTRPFVRVGGQTYTRRQLFEWFLTKRGHSIAPGTNLFRLDVNEPGQVFRWFMDAPESVMTAMHNLLTYTAAHGDPVRGRKIGLNERLGRFTRKSWQIADGLLDDVFAPFALAANFFDIAFKWSTLQSILENAETGRSVADGIGQVLTSGQFRRFDDLDEAVRHIDEYFVNPYATGRSVSVINNFVRPFAVWSMANPPMQIRHMLRNPHLYLAYHRVRNFVNTPLAEDEDYNDANVPSWVLESYPVYLSRDDRGNPIVMLPNNFDPISDTFSWALSGSAEIRRVFLNQKLGTQEQLREQARSRAESFENYLVRLFGSGHLPWKILAEQLTGRDAFTGRSFLDDDLNVRPTFLGMRMNPRAIYILNKVPFLEWLDRTNPWDMFGEAPRFSSDGQQITPGRLSWLGTERGRRNNIDQLDQNFGLQLLRLAGLNVRTIDYEENVKYTISDIERTANELAQSIDSARLTLQNGTTLSEAERSRITRERDEKINIWYQLMYDHARVMEWARERNVLPNDALFELQKLDIQVRQLPDPNIETINRITEDAIRMRTGQE